MKNGIQREGGGCGFGVFEGKFVGKWVGLVATL